MSTTKLIFFICIGAGALFAGYEWVNHSFSADDSYKVEGELGAIEVEKEEIALPVIEQLPVDPTLEVNRIEELFNTRGAKLPIVETLTYKAKVPWQKGRPAWLSDYANHYKTSRHFIARSLNGTPDYLKQEIKEGDQFNVLRSDIDISFYLVLDTSRYRLWLYYIDKTNGVKELIKSYPVSIGRIDPKKESGLLTPRGIYSLGDKAVTHDISTLGYYQGEKTEMIRIFGTRWIPFAGEVAGCTAPPKGFGLHGVPWVKDPITGQFREETSSIGTNDSDGCVRLKTADIEELYAIIITRPTQIEITPDYQKAVK